MQQNSFGSGSIREQVRDDEIWSKSMKEDKILPELVLSYYLMPRHLKQCFSYCSVFPKGYGLNNVILIQFWMAHGVLQSNENEEPESIGMRYINELRSRSFLQNFDQDFDFLYFQMPHDVHELATKIAKNECFVIGHPNSFYSSNRSWRHLSVVDASAVREESSSRNKLMRSILFFGMRPSQSVVESCISSFPNLRVLDLRNYGMEVLPGSIA
ncbi:hypothetical protein Ddye_024312 [Dipteronia dyeriana]|uniref:Disease resistance protein winged helix domain-containing protein n=1 Tax=Dipteronia dyeriana TaxID=168575 RepID=A0AAD9TUM4_9ROSI|nr:hypothetical protein Ddye_024312 [Dipteronia dyeriana]